MKYYTFEGDLGEKEVIHDIPEEMREKAEMMRDRLLDTVTVFDDALVEKYLEGQEISQEELKSAIRK